MKGDGKKPPGARLIELLKKYDWNTAVRILKKERAAGACQKGAGGG